jgi:hypothetical protein
MANFHYVVMLLLCCASVSASQRVVINASTIELPLHYLANDTKRFGQGVNEHSELVIEGVNHDSKARIVVLRFDDGSSTNYRSRLNIERVVRPGAFAVHLPLYGLKTGIKRKFNWRNWQKFILFSDGDGKKVSVDRISITKDASFSEASLGYDLGLVDSPVLKGMRQITPKFIGLKGRRLKGRHYVSGNPLNSDGIEGIESLDVDVPNGRWDVTLWFAMKGEWENLPRQRNQHIKMQGKTVWQRNLTPMQWLKSDYLAGQYHEAYLDGTPWQLFGNKPKHRITATVEVTDGQLHLSLSGRISHDNYLSGIFISPTSLKGSDTASLFDALKKRFEQKWQVVNYPDKTTNKRQQVELEQVYFDRLWQPDLPRVNQDEATVVIPDSQAIFDFAITSPKQIDNVMLRLTLKDSAGKKLSLPVEVRQGIWRYQRPLGESTLLSLSADELQSVYPGKLLRLPKTLSRRINLVVPIPAGFSSRDISGELILQKGADILATEQFSIKVLDISLPPVRQSVGVYHEKAPHWRWFAQLSKNADTNMVCDYNYLDKLGLTALSPPLSTPGPVDGSMTPDVMKETVKPYVADLRKYRKVFGDRGLDYTTIKRLENEYRHRGVIKQRLLSAMVQSLKNEELPLPQFAVIDEVHEYDVKQLSQFSKMIAQLQSAMPTARFVGQLNKPANRQLVPLLDTLLINHGFGVSNTVIKELQKQGKTVWLYNMNRMRLAAGFYLWQSKAQGYLQWHGRMPTGDPFSPVDGREADFQMIYPTLQACLEKPDINSALLAIAQGIMDRRWLNWLIREARTQKEALKLLSLLRQQIPTKWSDVEALKPQRVHQWRNAITNLAQKLTKKRG